ncbi:MAG: putative mannosyltransferase/glycosyltransferase, partial [Hyphomicrobiales bacterium]|nr:putative mannosyltransferase/glycosyltransferase [Hyphomicrobiales bacterium]
VTLFAPDARGDGFFRTPLCAADAFPVAPAARGMTDMVEQRIADYVQHFEDPALQGFDVYHAHDGISGNALATLATRGLIPGFLRTVHHLDAFEDQRLEALQTRSILAAERCLAVSPYWAERLNEKWGLDVGLSGNGVDATRFAPRTTWNDDAQAKALRERLDLDDGPVFLSVGGVEARKNTLRILEAFIDVQTVLPDAQLVIAGGASLLDHGAYQAAFARCASKADRAASRIHRTGPLPDDDMPALYRMADALVFASVKEGFGLCVLEALATGLPAVVSAIPPFTDWLDDADVLWCDPAHPASIASGMVAALNRNVRIDLARRGPACAARHGWDRVARDLMPVYSAIMERADA